MTRFSKLEQDDIQAEADDEQIADTKYTCAKLTHAYCLLISLSPCHLEGVTPLIQCLVDRIKGQQLMAQTSFLPELKCCYLYHLKWKLQLDSKHREEICENEQISMLFLIIPIYYVLLKSKEMVQEKNELACLKINLPQLIGPCSYFQLIVFTLSKYYENGIMRNERRVSERAYKHWKNLIM